MNGKYYEKKRNPDSRRMTADNRRAWQKIHRAYMTMMAIHYRTLVDLADGHPDPYKFVEHCIRNRWVQARRSVKL